VSSVFYLNQTVDPRELVARLRKLVGVLEGMTPEQFRQVTVWLRNVIKRKLPGALQEEADRVLEENDPQEVEKVITRVMAPCYAHDQRFKSMRILSSTASMVNEVTLPAIDKSLSLEIDLISSHLIKLFSVKPPSGG